MFRTGRHTTSVLALSCGLLFSLDASSQDKPESPPAQVASDVVMLNNGGMLRGTIAEMIPGGSVTIVTMTGMQKQFPMSEVKYAGPADKAPSAGAAPSASDVPRKPEGKGHSHKAESEGDGKTRPMAVVHAPDANLKLVARKPLTFFRRSGTAIGTATIGLGGAGNVFRHGLYRTVRSSL